jgi:hypothetical protein
VRLSELFTAGDRALVIYHSSGTSSTSRPAGGGHGTPGSATLPSRTRRAVMARRLHPGPPPVTRPGRRATSRRRRVQPTRY